jgi:hypothetical protein
MTVQRSDLEDTLRDIQEVIEDTAEATKNTGVLVAAGVVVLVLLVYLSGRRKGRKAATRVEVYRLR